MAAATPPARRGPDAAEAARRIARAGRAAIRPPASVLPESAAQKVSAKVWRAHIPDTYAASGPNREPGRILIPGDGAAGDQEAQNRPVYADARGLSRLKDFLALWSQVHLPSCNRPVTSTSIHMARPGPASFPRGHAPL